MDRTSGNLRYPPFPEETSLVDCTPDEREALDFINKKIAGAKSLVETIDFLFNTTQGIFPCDRIGIAFTEEGGSRLKLHYVKANYEPLHLSSGYSSDISGSSLDDIFRSGNPRIINDLSRYAAEHPGSESTELLLKEGVRSSMTCPLTLDGNPVGVMFRSSRNSHAYSDRHIQLHLAIAERLGQAVEKAYRIEQLTDAINSYMEMLGFVSHELKSPLASIITLAKTFRDGYFGALQVEHRDIVDRIIKQAENLYRLSAEFLNLSSVESGMMRVSLVDTKFIIQVINPSIDVIAPQIEELKSVLMRDIPHSEIGVTCDPELMKIAIINLLGNAVKYGNTGGTIRISVKTSNGLLSVSVWNEGPGFPEEQKKHLFRKFSRLQSPELIKRKGSGIGLYLTWKIISLHRGRIRARSEEGKWAEFMFDIPIGR